MTGLITEAARSPEMAELLKRLRALMPEGTALFVVAIGPPSDTQWREVAMGGPLDDADSLSVAAQALAGRHAFTGGIVLKPRMN